MAGYFVRGLLGGNDLNHMAIIAFKQIVVTEHGAACSKDGNFLARCKGCSQSAVFAHFIGQNELRINRFCLIHFSIERKHVIVFLSDQGY